MTRRASTVARSVTLAPVLAPPDDRLTRVEPGPDAVLTQLAAAQIAEWIAGWRDSARLVEAQITTPGPLFLHGPPGTGKTSVTRMLARQLRGQREVYVIDAMRVTESYLGATSANIAKAADAAIRSGAVLVLEEIDTLACQRTYGSSSEVENTRSTTSIMRVLELDGPIVLTSNRLDVLDPAVLRRCEYLVEMPALTLSQREAVIARELGCAPPPALGDLDLARALPIARRARRSAFLTGADVTAVLEGML